MRSARRRRSGIRTSGHIPMALTTEQAVDAGISSIEHLDYAYNAGAKDEAASSTAAAKNIHYRSRLLLPKNPNSFEVAHHPVHFSTPATRLRFICTARKTAAHHWRAFRSRNLRPAAAPPFPLMTEEEADALLEDEDLKKKL